MKYPILAALGLLLLLPAAGPSAAAKKADAPAPIAPPVETPKAVTTGVYQDAAGTRHPWSITPGHVLDWDNAPYLPVGGAFTPHYWVEGQTDANWALDMQALNALKKHGVHDLYLYAGDKGLTHIPPAAVQKVIDYLDANGFRYGLEIADFPKDPLIGYVVKPSVYRDPSPSADTPTKFAHITGLADAFYMLASSRDAEIEETGAAQVVNQDTAVVPITTGGNEHVLLLYPQRLFFAGTPESHLPDLWQGYDEYRDRLLSYFSKIKLGAGFRFFLDPLTDKIGFNGEVANLIPTTDGYRLDFQAWLDRKYRHNVDDLDRGWGIRERGSLDFQTAARSIPLWYQSRGIPAVYDPVTKKTFAVINEPRIEGHLWEDLSDFRIESTRGYMNAIADALKKGVADVPVIYKWTQHNPLFTNDQADGGFDGLGMEAYGHGRALITQSAAYTFAQAEEAPKTTWLIVSGTQQTDNLADKTEPGYTSKAVLFDDWDYLKEIGARGFFTQALQRLPAQTYAKVNLAAIPDQLGWLGSYAAALQASAGSLTSPNVLWYPADVPSLDIGVRQLGDNLWWLPSYRPGSGLFLGRDLQGYSLPSPEGYQPTSVLWSPRGALSQAQFAFGKKANPVVTDASGVPLKVGKKGDVWTIPVGDKPVLVSHVPEIPLPLNAFDAATKEAQRLIALADSEKVEAQRYKDHLFYVLNSIPNQDDNVETRYGLLQRVVGGLTQALRPYAWLEAENANQYTFDSLIPDSEASGGAYLSLDTEQEPPRASADSPGGYRAEYKFTVNAPGAYTLWMAGSPLGTRDVSPFTYKIDDGGANEVRGALTEGSAYAGKFVWSNLGQATLTRGPHTLTLVVTGRRPADDHFALAIDAFCITRVPFSPDGVNQPPIDTSTPALLEKAASQ